MRAVTPPAATLAQRRALASAFAGRYAGANKTEKTHILDQVCAATGWHRSHARRALLQATHQKPARPARGRHAKYNAEVVAALTLCWTILDRPAGKRLAPMLPELVPVLRRHGELEIDDDTARLLMGMSAATIDRRLVTQRQQATKAPRIRPGSLLRNELPLLTWAEWDNTRPGFMEVSLTRHDAGRPGAGEPLRTVSVTDIATGWTENRTVSALGELPQALGAIARSLPFPLLGLDSGGQGSGVDGVLLRWCEQRRVTFTHARPAGNGNHHVGQKNWRLLHTIAGGHRYETQAEQGLFNRIWPVLSKLTNFFHPQQRALPADGEHGVGRSGKAYETTTPYRRTERHGLVSVEDKAILADSYACLNPADLYRQIKMLATWLQATASRRTAAGRAGRLVRWAAAEPFGAARRAA